MLETGSPAPVFALPDQQGKMVSLKDFAGQKVVVYFYSRDNTAGCTRQAEAFAKLYDEFKKLNVAVIGISKDTETSHAKFAQKLDLPFTILADPELSAIKAYDVWHEKNMYGKKVFGVVRSSFIIDEQGKILKAYSKVKPDLNAGEVLEFLKSQ